VSERDASERDDAERDETERDPGGLADQMERDARKMEERTEALGGEVSDVREDWQRKRSALDVPGANPPEEDSEDRAEADGEA
jgi:hypothetical protein